MVATVVATAAAFALAAVSNLDRAFALAAVINAPAVEEGVLTGAVDTGGLGVFCGFAADGNWLKNAVTGCRILSIYLC